MVLMRRFVDMVIAAFKGDAPMLTAARKEIRSNLEVRVRAYLVILLSV